MEVLKVVPSVAGAIAAIAAVMALYFVARQISANTTAALYTQMLEIDRYFALHPEIRPYFYGSSEKFVATLQ